MRIEAPPDDVAPGIGLAVERLKRCANVVEWVGIGGVRPREAHRSNELTIVLGNADASPELQARWKRHAAAREDSYLVATLSKEPLVVAASGVNARGTLYAAYHLADLLRGGADLSTLDAFFQPRIARRFVSFGATTHGRREYRPDLYWKTLNELPAFGYNGVVIYPGGGTPVGRRSSPIPETDAGELAPDAENTARWRDLLARVKGYQLQVMMTVPPAVPPGFDRKTIADYYAGGAEPPGYLVALKTHFRKYLGLLRETYPTVDLYMFNSTEGATFGRSERFFGAPGRYPAAAYRQNNRAVMTAYLDVLTDVFADRRGTLAFWTHSFGLTSEGLVEMRKVLFDYPDVAIIEDDFWNNNLWPFDLPAMNYLPPDLRAEVSSHRNPFALFQIATDGEYYGGGSLPNAYPGSHIRTAREALARKASMVIQRLDLHDRTPWGTAFGSMAIVPLAASKQLWEPTPDEDEIWRQWAEGRFGRAAAAPVVAALRESQTVLAKGLSCNGIDLLAVGSEFNPRLWARRGAQSRFKLFGRPGVPFVKKGPGEPIASGEYTTYQMQTRSIAIDEFRRNQAAAMEAARRGLDRVEQARPVLAPADYEMLRQIFQDGTRVLDAVRLLGEAAYAANLLLDNFDHVAAPRALYDKAMAAMEAFLASDPLPPEMARNLRTILADYQGVVSSSSQGVSR